MTSRVWAVLLDADDPRRLGRTITPTDPRPTAELQQEKISRFQTKTWYCQDCINFLVHYDMTLYHDIVMNSIYCILWYNIV